MADLRVHINGLELPNPFIIGSGPPSTNANVINKAFDEGWGAVVTKTALLDATKINNVAPRYARMRAADSREVLGWENIELITDRPFGQWLDEFKRIKDKHPDRILIASITEEYAKDPWQEIVGRTQETGVDALELNLSCPHGLPEQKMGSAIGQDASIVEDVCRWVKEVSTVPVWVKMTPNVTSVVEPARAAMKAGCDGIAAINTILCVMGINLDTLRPEPTVEGFSVPGGYSGKAIKPITLRMIMEIATMMYGGNSGKSIPPELDAQPAPDPKQSKSGNIKACPIKSFCTTTPMGEFPNGSLSAIGGIESGNDAAQFILLGAQTAQVCTGVMIHGYELIHKLCAELSAFMDRHGFDTIEDFRGHALQYFTTHAELFRRLTAVKSGRHGKVHTDTNWDCKAFVQQSDDLVANE